MTATLRVTSALKEFLGGREEITVASGRTVRETLVENHLKPELIALVIVGEEQKTKDYLIQDGDVIKVLAVIGGG